MKFKKFAIFADLKLESYHYIKSLKKSVKSKISGKKLFFNHKPHITIFTFYSNCKKEQLIDIFIKKKPQLNKNSIKIKTINFFVKDIQTGLDTLHFEIEKSYLLEYQKSFYSIFKNCISHNLSIFNKNFTHFQTLRENIKLYGFPFYGETWIPHVTIGSYLMNEHSSIPKNIEIKKNIFLSKFSFHEIDENHDYKKLK